MKWIVSIVNTTCLTQSILIICSLSAFTNCEIRARSSLFACLELNRSNHFNACLTSPLSLTDLSAKSSVYVVDVFFLTALLVFIFNALSSSLYLLSSSSNNWLSALLISNADTSNSHSINSDLSVRINDSMPDISNCVGLRLVNRSNHFSAVSVFTSLSSKYTLNRAASFFFFTGVTNNFSFFFSSFCSSSSSEITDNLN